MTLWTLLQAVLMVLNGFAVLNEDRFLNKFGLGMSSIGQEPSFGGENKAGGIKSQVVGFVHAVSYLRMPLIGINTVVILVKIVFG